VTRFKLLAALTLTVVIMADNAFTSGPEGRHVVAAERMPHEPRAQQATLHGSPMACAGSPAAVTRFTREQVAAAVEPIAERAIREQGVAGLSVGVAHRGEVLHAQGFGLADLAHQRPATGDTQYDVGSIAKTFTALALLQLVEEGRLSLDDPVSRHLPGYDGPMAGARIRELLNHTSGFRGGPDIDEEVRQPELERPQTMAELLAMPIVAEARSEFAPGPSFQYLNSGYHLLRVVVDAVTGREYGETVADRIFAPAGMANSVAADRSRSPHAAQFYMRRDTAMLAVPPIHPHVLTAVISSVRDLLAFQCALDSGRFISPASLALMNTPARIGTDGDSLIVPFGLGVMLSPPEWRQKRGHQGTFPGGSAQVAHYPDEDLTIVVLTNTNGPGVIQAREIEPRIAHALFGDTPPGLSHMPLPIDEAFARVATGRFRFRGFSNIAELEEGELRVRDPDTGELHGRLIRVGPLATVFLAANVEPAEALRSYRLSDPPYELSIYSPGGDRTLWFREGGMLWDVGVREGRPPEK
jgi:D-alanyl-D-alanine carboxypeptidase